MGTPTHKFRGRVSFPANANAITEELIDVRAQSVIFTGSGVVSITLRDAVLNWGTQGVTYANSFIAPARCIVDTFALLSDTASTAQIAATHYAFQAYNVVGTGNLFSAGGASLVGNDIAANTVKLFVPDQNNILAQNDVVNLAIVATGTGNTAYLAGSLKVQVRYRPV